MISDTHFGHANICNFKRADGVTPLRPWTDVHDMDEAMIERWNSRVRPTDKVYHLGDVVINRRALNTLSRLNGDKVLIKGNHDIFRMSDYSKHFRDIRGYHVLAGMILSHIPVHDSTLYRFGTNIHGHLHDKRVLKPGSHEIDPRYIAVCVEQIDYTPISMEEVQDRIRAQGGVVGFRDGNGPQVD